MWLIVLLVMAAAAYLVVKAVLKNADPAARSSTEALSPPDADDISPTSTDQTVQVDSDVATAQMAAGAGASSGTLLASAGSEHGVSGEPSASSGQSSSINAETSADSDTLDAKAAAHGVNSGDEARDVHELIKILNLRDSDASRLGIDKSQFNTLASGSATDVSANTVSSVRQQLIRWLS